MMLEKNLTLALRHIRREWLFSAINIFGLSISMAACFLIFQYALFELSYDKQYKNYQNIFRVTTTSYEGDFPRYPSALSSVELAQVLKEKLPEVLGAGRICTTGWFDCAMSYMPKDQLIIFNEKRLRFADQGFLSLFHDELIRGDARTALAKPFSAVLSIKTAKKYFGAEESLGKVVHLKGSGDEHDYTVTGVMPDPPANSHMDAEILLSANSINGNSIMPNLNVYTYIRLNEGIDRNEFVGKLQPITDQVFPPKENFRTTLTLQPISSIHLHSNLQDELKPVGNASSLYFLLAIAIVLLLVAWINYINLATSRAVERAKEVSVRKVIGASRKQIIFQFLTEALVINCFGLLGAVAIVYFFAPSFYTLVGLSFPYQEFFKWNVNEIATSLLMVVVAGIGLAAFFPAHVISSFNPVKAIKGKGLPKRRSFSFRQAAVVFQFTCAIFLLITVVAFNRQFNFMRSQNLGIEITKAIIAKSPSNADSSYRFRLEGFKGQLRQLAIIESVTTSTSVPGDQTDEWTGVIRKEKDKATQDFGIYVIDPDFIPAYKLRLLAGRNFQNPDYPLKKFGQKLEPVILNRTATQRLGFVKPDEAIGEFIYWGVRKEASKCVIVGVIEDYHQESLKEPIKPLFYTVLNGPTMTLKLTDGASKNMSQALLAIQNAWSKFFPDNPFDYSFLEDDYNSHYAADVQVVKVFNAFCLLALVISSLGIFGLALFSIGQRTKEISIRKVLGASVLNLLQLVTREYLVLIAAASLIALPLAFWGVQEWLNGFSIKVELSAWIFFFPIIFILVIALLTVSGQALIAVNRNPVDQLKNE
jgi:putative ABC transport system permease protein